MTKASAGFVSICLLVLFSWAAPAQGQFSDWINSVGGDWQEPTNWSAGVPGGGTTARFNAGGTYGISMDESNNVGGIDWVDPGASLTVAGTFFSFSTLTVGSDFTVNGTLNLNGVVDGIVGFRGAILDGDGMVTNAPSGTINFGGASAGTSRFLRADDFFNHGVVNVDQPAFFDQTDGIYSNHGAIHIASGKTLEFGTNNVFNQNAGTLDNQGTFAFDNDTLNFNGGNFTGNPVELANSTLNNNTTGTGVFNLTKTNTYSGDVDPGQTLNLLSTGNSAQTTTVTTDLVNRGTINMVENFGQNKFTVLFRDGMITNASTGVINMGGTGGGTRRFVRANQFANNGTVNVDTPSAFDHPGGVYTNNSDINVAAGSSLMMGTNNTFNQDAGTFDNQGEFRLEDDVLNFNGGNFTGNPVELANSTLNNNTTGTGVFNLTKTNTYSGDVDPGQTLNLLSTGNSAQTTTVTTDLVNRGTINMVENFGQNKFTVLFRDGMITNASTGVINMGGTGGGTRRFVRANQFANNGTVNVDAPSAFDHPGGVYANSGQITNHDSLLTVSNSSTLTNLADGMLSGTGTFDVGDMGLQNDGMIDPGFNAGQLTFDGDVTFGTTADLRMELGGTTQATEYDFLEALDTLDLDGALSVRFLSGFQNTVTPGDTFTIVSASALNGTFAGLANGARVVTTDGFGTFQVNYSGNDVVLGSYQAYLSGDFDGMGGYTCADVDALVADIAAGNNTPMFDMDGDGAVDQTDLDLWLAQAGSAAGFSGPIKRGDADLSGTVDGVDFLAWNDNKFTINASFCDGDFTADGVIDGADFLAWNDNKFTSSAAVSVPEPTASWFALLTLLLCGGGCHRSSWK